MVMCSVFDVSAEICEVDKYRVISNAQKNLETIRSPLSEKSIRNEIKREQGTFLKKPVNKYVILTSWSGRIGSLTTRIDDVQITFSLCIPKRFADFRSRCEKRALAGGGLDCPAGWETVRLLVAGRSPEEAAIRALGSFDLLRGIWNLALTYRTLRWTTFPGRKPMSSVTIGPVHSIHQTSGELASEEFMFEPSWQGTAVPRSFSDTQKSVLDESRKYTLKQTKDSPLRAFVLDGLKSYARALDVSDSDYRYLRLWQLLEYLTNADTNDRLIKRIRWVYKSPDFHIQVLEHLRIQRNTLVHSSKDAAHREEQCNQVKQYVDTMLCFLIEFCRIFDNTEQLCQVLDTNVNAPERHRAAKILRLADFIRST